jgi:hypothetical protein
MHFRLWSAVALVTLVSAPAWADNDQRVNRIKFTMVPSAGASRCLANASAHVRVDSIGPVDIMDVGLSGLPPNTVFDLFILQVPKSPFGLSWYQGDIETDDKGNGHQQFVGVFSKETFIIAPGSQPAPVVFDTDDASNPATPGPVQIYHLGLWFDSHTDAQNAGCAGTPTPFNGEHNAGIQAMNTSNFPDLHGPLLDLDPSTAPIEPVSMKQRH